MGSQGTDETQSDWPCTTARCYSRTPVLAQGWWGVGGAIPATCGGALGTPAQLSTHHRTSPGHPRFYKTSRAWSSQTSIWHSRPLPASSLCLTAPFYFPTIHVCAYLWLCTPILSSLLCRHGALLVHSPVSTTRMGLSTQAGGQSPPHPRTESGI